MWPIGKKKKVERHPVSNSNAEKIPLMIKFLRFFMLPFIVIWVFIITDKVLFCRAPELNNLKTKDAEPLSEYVYEFITSINVTRILA